MYFLSSLTLCFGIVVTNDGKTIFDIAIVLKITIFPSSVIFPSFSSCLFELYHFPYFQNSFNICYNHKFFTPLSIFRCKRNGYLVFLMYRYLDLYNAYHTDCHLNSFQDSNTRNFRLC